MQSPAFGKVGWSCVYGFMAKTCFILFVLLTPFFLMLIFQNHMKIDPRKLEHLLPLFAEIDWIGAPYPTFRVLPFLRNSTQIIPMFWCIFVVIPALLLFIFFPIGAFEHVTFLAERHHWVGFIILEAIPEYCWFVFQNLYYIFDMRVLPGKECLVVIL